MPDDEFDVKVVSNWLQQEFGYNRGSSDSVAKKMAGASASLRQAFLSWKETGEIPEISVEGETVASMMRTGLEVSGAFATLASLESNPVRTRKVIEEIAEHGYDTIPDEHLAQIETEAEE